MSMKRFHPVREALSKLTPFTLVLGFMFISVCADAQKPQASSVIQKQPRPGWACPNHNSFETCDHQCKWIYIVNGKPDLNRERSCGPEIAAHSPQAQNIWGIINQTYASAFSSCSQTSGQVLVTQTPCNYFAGMALSSIWGYNDFKTKSGYMTAAQINNFLNASSLTDRTWQRIDSDYASVWANSGLPVIASTNKHVAVVVPGSFTYSYRLQEFSPSVYSMFINDVPNNKAPIRCMPCYADGAFFPDRPQYFLRTR
jgi:hypothetical protein